MKSVLVIEAASWKYTEIFSTLCIVFKNIKKCHINRAVPGFGNVVWESILNKKTERIIIKTYDLHCTLYDTCTL